MLTCLAYLPSLTGPFIFDDAVAIVDNPSIKTLFAWPGPLAPPPGSAVTGRPIVNLTLALNHALNVVLGVPQDAAASGQVIGYHLVNLLLHLATGLLLAGVLARSLATGRFGAWWQERAALAGACIATVWLLHPIQVDAVAYVIQRTELLASCFLLATLYASIRAWTAPTSSSRTRWYLVGIAACALGMGSKEIMVGAPLLVLLHDRVVHLTGWRDLLAPEHRSRLGFHLALAATLLILVGILLGAPRGSSIGFAAGIPWYEYLHTQGWVIARYLRLMVFPLGQTVDYGSTPIPHWQGVPGLLLLTAAGISTLLAWRHLPRWGAVALAGSWFFVLLAPSSSVVPIVTEVGAERRMYLASAAVIVLLVVAGVQALARLRRTVPPAAGLVLLLLLTGLTAWRTNRYAHPEALWREATRVRPDNARAWYNVGTLVAEGPLPAQADSWFEAALLRDPSHTDARLQMVLSAIDHRDAEGAQYHLQRLPLTNGMDTVLTALGTTLFGADDTTAALLVLEHAATRPSRVETLTSLGVLYRILGDLPRAVAVIRQAHTMAPDDADVTRYLGEMLLEDDQIAEAVPLLVEAARHDPGSGIGRALLSLALARNGQPRDAEAEALRAATLVVNDPEALTILAQAMLISRLPERAVIFLDQALALDPGHPQAGALRARIVGR